MNKVLEFPTKKPKLPELVISIDATGNHLTLPVIRTDLERRQFLAAIMLFHTDLVDRQDVPEATSDAITPILLLISVAPTGVATMSLSKKLTRTSLKALLKELMRAAACLGF